jgi:enoyl-[acyl-carrier protein] reductase I
MGFLAGKRLLITGVLNNRSIAYGVARACHREGAELAFSYQGERFKERITEFAAEFGSKLIFDCDVGSDEQITALFDGLKQAWPEGFDGFVHSIGFAPREAIAGEFLDGLSREGFRIAHDISSYSFPAMAKASLEASVRYLAAGLGPKGIRVNGISAGPIKTLAASGIKGFSKLLGVFEENAPLRRTVTIEDVGNVAAFMLSDLSSGMTAEISYVDAGFSQVMGGGAALLDA